jgi:two-component system, sensor histidine kinase PdtaS
MLFDVVPRSKLTMPLSKSMINLEDLRPEDHLCLLYRTEQELQSVISQYLRLGLERMEKVIYVGAGGETESVVNRWAESLPEAKPHCSAGQLRIHTFTEMVMPGGVFDPDRMIRVLQNETKIALAEGWLGLRMATDMTWAVRGLPGSARLVEFEAKSNRFYCHSKCLAMCLYDCRRFSPLQLLYALSTHPTVMVGGQVYDNLYYRIPPSFIRRESPSTILDDWLYELAGRDRTAVV